MKNILLSAFACDPLNGSEPGNGWNWSIGLAKRGYSVHCLTRITNKSNIEKASIPDNLQFHYIRLPLRLEFLYSFSQPTMYIYYLLWQWVAYRKAKKLHPKYDFKITHHVTWGSTQMGSYLHKIKVPFIFGPAGGGQTAPKEFSSYFQNGWRAELKREFISKILVKYNGNFKRMLKKAKVIISSNPETQKLVIDTGSENCIMTLDAALPDAFFPPHIDFKRPAPNTLKLLWVGRFIPRKGLLLVLDVMNELKAVLNIQLTVVGDGDMMAQIVKKINEYQLSETVHLVGAVPYEKVKEFYKSHDVFFFTSLRDSCPAQLIEAMAYSMPVVTLNLHGQAIIVNDNTGIRCSVDSPQKTIRELREALLKLYENPLLVNQLSKNAYLFAKGQTWDQKINSIVQDFYPEN